MSDEHVRAEIVKHEVAMLSVIPPYIVFHPRHDELMRQWRGC